LFLFLSLITQATGHCIFFPPSFCPALCPAMAHLVWCDSTSFVRSKKTPPPLPGWGQWAVLRAGSWDVLRQRQRVNSNTYGARRHRAHTEGTRKGRGGGTSMERWLQSANPPPGSIAPRQSPACCSVGKIAEGPAIKKIDGPPRTFAKSQTHPPTSQFLFPLGFLFSTFLGVSW
jgi:hypothetical protein